MNYISTRGKVEPIGFQDAVMMGLADDGGLLVPQRLPDVTDRLAAWGELSYRDLAWEVLRLFATDIPPDELRDLVDRSYGRQFSPDVAPVVGVGGLFVCELWHGPTLAFKDVALQLLGNLFEYILARRGGSLNILGATSGDTGSAAIYGVRGRRGMDIFVMHPDGRVSPIQERQMTTVLDDNVHNIALEGSFDDCQRVMKTLAADVEFKRTYSLGAVNSVNWARVLAQIVYYFHAAFAVQRATGRREVAFSVPTGNFGDILAGYYALRMGLPVARLILATNENDILSRFFTSGTYSLGQVHHTLSPSMDIQVASNFERYLFDLVGCDAQRLCGLMDEFAATGSLHVPAAPGQAVDERFVAGVGDTAGVLETIRATWRDHGYLLDPHTAVGVRVAQEHDGGIPTICLATAHPAKFSDAIRQATGEDLAHHPRIDELMHLPTRCRKLPNDLEAVREFIVQTVEG